MEMKFFGLLMLLTACSSIHSNKSRIWRVNQFIKVHETFLDVKTTVHKTEGEAYHLCHDDSQSGSVVSHNEVLEFSHQIRPGQDDEAIRFHKDTQGAVLYTQLQPLSFCKLFPVPRDRLALMDFDLRIDLPADWVLVGFSEPSVVSEYGSRKIWRIKTVDPIPYQSFAFVAGQLKENREHPHGQGPGLYSLTKYNTPEIQKILDEYLEIQNLVFDFFKFRPGKVYNLVTLPDFGPGAMENYGMITVTDDLFQEVGKPDDWREIRRFVLLHESVHQVIGNCLIAPTKDQVFLVEGLTQFFSQEISEKHAGFKNPFQGALSKGYSLDVTESNMELFFTKYSYELGSSLFKKISAKRGSEYLRSRVEKYFQENGCGEFDFKSLDESLKARVFSAEL